MNKTRFEAFSDSVFAFAITLLVLGFTLPTLSHPTDRDLLSSDLFRALGKLWPNLIAYLLSFAVIGIMWQNHHAIFRLVRYIDRRTIFLNLLLLGVTVFIPFATSALGTYPTMHASTFLYGVTLSLCATAFNLLLLHLVRSNAFSEGVPPHTIRETVIAYRVGWITYVVATLVALFIPLLSFALYILIVLYYVVPRGVDTDIPAT
jgi:TMEM175 potassium channel family protein